MQLGKVSCPQRATSGCHPSTQPRPSRRSFLNSGQTGTITVTITPSGASGTVVRGTLYLGNFVQKCRLTPRPAAMN